ncbi:MAG: peptidoglycan DD-metalloendopeptidase family protein [Flavobacteriales bacterium]|nr:Murein DD-endopeptidase MepM [Flavobacteriales bacterium]MCC6578223.1 peptidoglycan DD-metalloendopeptidase family protein [Flavobacteriales bacterium]NUQ14334.1 peptidoglycan DD-metalloendopeptidase family protein [Flavobacteriales bacterium]
MRRIRLWGTLAGMLVLVLAIVLTVDLAPPVEYVPDPATAAVEDTLPDPPSAYGIPLDGFVVERAKVHSGSTFGDLLAAHGVPYPLVDSLVRLADGVFDVRRMRAGHPIAFIFTDDAHRQLRYFVYEADAVEHVVFTTTLPLGVHVHRRPIITTERSVEVAVTGALYNDLARAGVDPLLSLQLAEVFAWTVDFYRIQKGDRFTVVFLEQRVDGAPYGPPRILAARYHGGDQAREAFLFAPEGGKEAYFDGEGNSLRKAFLKAPLKYSRISSGFSMRRFHPVQKRFKAHLGTDYAAPYGTPILAVGDGVVEKAGYTAGNGNYVKLRHNGTYSTQYLHMRKILVRTGQRVQQGQTIGEVGSTGLATGPHVCFRFWKNGKQVDHRREEFPSAEPVAAAHRDAFQRERDRLLLALDQAGGREVRPVVF